MDECENKLRRIAGAEIRLPEFVLNLELRRLKQPLSGWSAGFVDFDNDGWKDLYSANGDVDTQPDAIGAKVTVTTPSGRVLYNRVNVSVGFMSSSDKRVFFGLGDETKASSVEITGPRGAVQKLPGVKADRFVKVEEPRQ